MRFVMFSKDCKKGVAVSTGGPFHGFLEGEAGFPGDLDALVQSEADLAAIGAALQQGAPVDLDACQVLPPLGRSSKIICVGLNYAAHSKEIGFEIPPFPTLFCRFATSLVGHENPIVKPSQSDQLDYEGEMAVIIGKRAKNVSKENALQHVAGYSLFNDGSVRDYQFLTPQWTIGKNFDASGAFGPWLVTPDELPPGGRGLAITTRLNGEVMQDSTTDNMMFGVAALIELLSDTMTLNPGDVIATGTPAGVGSSRKPPVFMKDGDVIEVEVQGIGKLRNPVAAAR